MRCERGVLFLAGVLSFGTSAIAQSGWTESVLHNFATPPRGASPSSGLIRDSSGNLYGTTGTGGTRGGGVVFKIDPGGNQTVLYNFTGGADGGSPIGVTGDGVGNLYGTTFSGGASNVGTVFKLNASGETVLHSFTGGADGETPAAGVILDSVGNLYGTTTWGGVNGNGVLFMMSPTGQETVLHALRVETTVVIPERD